MDQILGTVLAESSVRRNEVLSYPNERTTYVEGQTRTFLTARGYGHNERANTALGRGSSSEADLLVERIVETIVSDESGLTASDISDRLVLIEEDVEAAGLTQTEEEAIYSVASIARHSSEYWEENLDDWVDAYRASGAEEPLGGWASLRPPSCWRGIAAQDVMGGVVGAFGGMGGVVTGATIRSAIGYFEAVHLGLCN